MISFLQNGFSQTIPVQHSQLAIDPSTNSDATNSFLSTPVLSAIPSAPLPCGSAEEWFLFIANGIKSFRQNVIGEMQAVSRGVIRTRESLVELDRKIASMNSRIISLEKSSEEIKKEISGIRAKELKSTIEVYEKRFLDVVKITTRHLLREALLPSSERSKCDVREFVVQAIDHEAIPTSVQTYIARLSGRERESFIGEIVKRSRAAFNNLKRYTKATREKFRLFFHGRAAHLWDNELFDPWVETGKFIVVERTSSAHSSEHHENTSQSGSPGTRDAGHGSDEGGHGTSDSTAVEDRSVDTELLRMQRESHRREMETQRLETLQESQRSREPDFWQ
ncbi:hypothetical protein ADUPG1_009840 [Aduncisulcus paluster]|uniref:Uncharacterized protein n=1 Tax=Aduncisulcus paluster TaxID=2918883 RepID=A0ABQ5KZR9_9EUKA|nr:hypothetical protein ADUPG1_009840 [Aduncisulcus paluster]